MKVILDGVSQQLLRSDVDDTPANGATTVPPSSNWAFDHAAALDAHTKNPYEIYRTGEYILPGHYSITATVALAANQLEAFPIVVSRDMTFDRIAIEVTTLADPSNIRLGIYNNGTNLYPGTLLLDAGAVSGATTGVKTITISQQLVKGIYFLAIVADATPTVRGLAVTVPLLGLRATLLYAVEQQWRAAFTYAALPNPFTSGGTLRTDGKGIALRLLTLD